VVFFFKAFVWSEPIGIALTVLNVPHLLTFLSHHCQVQVTSPESVVTIELRCVYGFADVYTASESLPTPIEFSQRASCTLENGKVCRIMTKCGGGERGHISLLVHSQSTGALFSLWAYETGKMVIEVPEIKHTMKMIKAFDRLIANDEEELNIHLPRLLSEAYESVEMLEQKVSSASATFRSPGGSGNMAGSVPTGGTHSNGGDNTAAAAEDDEDDDDDGDVVERYIYRKSITLLRGDPTVNPNVDSDLMLPCLLPKKELPAVVTATAPPLTLPRIKGAQADTTTSKPTFTLKKHLLRSPTKQSFSLTQQR